MTDKGPLEPAQPESKENPDAAFQSSAGQSRGLPLLLTCEHASNAIPKGFENVNIDSDLINDHFGFDPGAEALTVDLGRKLAAPTVRATFSRLFIDANRAPNHPSCIRPHVMGRELLCNAQICDQERARRLAFHKSFHAAVNQSCEGFLDWHKRYLILSVHTFTPVLGKCDRRGFEVGILHDSEHEALAAHFQRLLNNENLNCRLNEPYSGLNGLVYLASRHGHEFDMPYLALEVRCDLLTGDADTRARIHEAILKAIPRLFQSGFQP